jgi:hypothetical protein
MNLIPHQTYPRDKIIQFIALIQATLETSTSSIVRKFYKRVTRIVELTVSYYLPASEFNNSCAYGDDSLKKFITIICEFFARDMVKHEVFMGFARKIYENVRDDEWKRLKPFFTQLFRESSTKMQETEPEMFALMSQLNEEHAAATRAIKSFNQRTRFDKKFKVIVEVGDSFECFDIPDDAHVLRYVADMLIGYACHTNPSWPIGVLKGIKGMRAVFIDEAMNRHVHVHCQKFLNDDETNYLDWQCCLRELAFCRLMTRRGVARIYRTVLKFMKLYDNFCLCMAFVVKFTYDCFMGRQMLEHDEKDIIEVSLKSLENARHKEDQYRVHAIEFLKKILANHARNEERSRPVAEIPQQEPLDEIQLTATMNDDEFMKICAKKVDEMIEKCGNHNVITVGPQLQLSFSVDDKPAGEASSAVTSDDLRMCLNMTDATAARFKVVFFILLVRKVRDESADFEARAGAVKLMAAAPIDHDNMKELIDGFLPLNEANLKLLNLTLVLMKEKIIENGDKLLLARVRNQLKKITKKAGNEEGAKASRKVSEILAVINGRESDECDDAAGVDSSEQSQTSTENEITPEPQPVTAEHVLNDPNPHEYQLNGVFNTDQQKIYVTLMEMIAKCEGIENQKIPDLINSPNHQSQVKVSLIDSKIGLVIFIKSIDNQPTVDADFIIALVEKLLNMESTTSNFVLMVIMRVFGERLDLSKSDKFANFFEFFKRVAAVEKDRRAKVFGSILEFRENGWKVSEYFDGCQPLKPNDLHCDELLIDFHLRETAVDEFMPALWKFLLTSGSNNKLVKLVSKCAKLHEDFTPKLVTFLTARCETFKKLAPNLTPDVVGSDKVRARLGRVAVFLVQLLNLKLINDDDLIVCLSQKLIEKIPHEFATKIMEIFKRADFSEKRAVNEQLQIVIKQFEYVTMIENNEK